MSKKFLKNIGKTHGIWTDRFLEIEISSTLEQRPRVLLL